MSSLIAAFPTMDELESVVGLDDERTIYNIPEANYARFEKEIAKLSRKSERMIGLPILPVPFSYEMVDLGNGEARKVIQVYLQAEQPKIAGWTFVARLDHSNETGNIIRAVPNTGIEIPESYRSVAPNCDHCGVRRKRRDTFLIRNDEDGSFQQVGSSCLEDFFGHDPYKIARLAEYLGYASEAARGSENDEPSGLRDNRYINLEEFLLCTARVVLQHGWVSAKAARESEERYDGSSILVSSRSRAQDLFNGLGGSEDWTQEERDLVEGALAWAQQIAENPQSDYEHNIAVIANASYIESRSLGLAASIVGVHYNNYRRLAGVKATQVGDLSGLRKMMLHAKDVYQRNAEKHGKRPTNPHISLTFDGGKPLEVTLASDYSKNPGCLYLKGRDYFGKITPDGEFVPSKAVTPTEMPKLVAVLESISNKPEGTAATVSKLMGRCCFCRQKLSKKESTGVGYGAICAATYGLGHPDNKEHNHVA